MTGVQTCALPISINRLRPEKQTHARAAAKAALRRFHSAVYHADAALFRPFGIKLGKSVSPFDEYECESVTTAYDTLLPLYVTTTVYRETAAVEVERDVNAVAEAYAAEKIDELRFVGDFNSDYTVKPLGAGLYRVNVFLSGEALISRGVEKSDGGGVAD